MWTSGTPFSRIPARPHEWGVWCVPDSKPIITSCVLTYQKYSGAQNMFDFMSTNNPQLAPKVWGAHCELHCKLVLVLHQRQRTSPAWEKKCYDYCTLKSESYKYTSSLETWTFKNGQHRLLHFPRIFMHNKEGFSVLLLENVWGWDIPPQHFVEESVAISREEVEIHPASQVDEIVTWCYRTLLLLASGLLP